MVELYADVRNRGTNTIAEVICHGEDLNRSRPRAVSRYKLRRKKGICHGTETF